MPGGTVGPTGTIGALASAIRDLICMNLICQQCRTTSLDCTTDTREDGAGICGDQPDRANDNDQKDDQNNSVFGNVLAVAVVPYRAKKLRH